MTQITGLDPSKKMREVKVDEVGQLKMVDGALAPKGYQQITSLSTAQSLTVPAGAVYALLQAEAKDLRWQDDGTNPTSSVGMLLVVGTDFWYSGNLAVIRFIESTPNGKLNVSYYG
jgi:hypothetical protein